ncbi:MAG: hypothetical protein E7442_05830 [Ruminococcaceae bacterium]|nr:hypothetical protein [Oscillospiraceae bacterium]
MSERFKTFTESRAFWFLVSLFASLILWLYVTNTEGIPTEKTFHDVKIEFLGENELHESSGLMVTEQDITDVDLTLSGLRRDLGKLNASNLSVTVDLNGVRSDGHYTMLYKIKYPENVDESAFTLVDSSRRSVNITVDRYISRKVEVKGSFSGSAAEGYRAEETPTFDPLVVKISGPQTLVESVDCAWVSITRENLNETISYDTTYTLLDSEGNPVDVSQLILETEEVNVTLTVLMTKTVALAAATIPGGGATGENCAVKVEPASIVLAGTAEELESINQIVVDTVNLAAVNSLYEASDLVIPIPNNTVNLSGVSTAAVRVEIQNLATSTLTVAKDDIVCINAGEGYTAEVITESLPILIRTTEADIGAIAAKNIRVVADLSEVDGSAGILNVPVKISVDGYPEAGAVGEYKIYVRVSVAG